MAKAHVLLAGLLIAYLPAIAPECLATKLYTVRAWHLRNGESISGRFEDVKDDAVAIVVAGSTRLVPFAELSYDDQLFLRDGLANTTRPLTLPIVLPPHVESANTIVAPPVVTPPPVIAADAEPQRTYYRPPQDKPKQVNYGQTTAVIVGEAVLLLAIVFAVLKIIYR
jgi:hypothetical protein